MTTSHVRRIGSAPRILAIDQGSISCGVAYFDGEDLRDTDLLRPRAALPWAERMDYIVEQLARASSARIWRPEVVAIEDVASYLNVKTAITMGETRGYLICAIRRLYPAAQLMDVHPSQTKAAVGAGRGRDEAKRRTALVVRSITGREVTEDENDAVAIGWAAIAKLRARNFEQLAQAGEQLDMSR